MGFCSWEFRRDNLNIYVIICTVSTVYVCILCIYHGCRCPFHCFPATHYIHLGFGQPLRSKVFQNRCSALVAPRSSFKAWNLLHSRSTEIRTCLRWDDTEFMAQLQQLTPMKPFSNLKPRFWVFS